MFDPTTPTSTFTPRVMAAGVVDRMDIMVGAALAATGRIRPLAALAG